MYLIGEENLKANWYDFRWYETQRDIIGYEFKCS